MKTPAATAWNTLSAGTYRTIEKLILQIFDIFMIAAALHQFTARRNILAVYPCPERCIRSHFIRWVRFV
jgi:hypothetical protein